MQLTTSKDGTRLAYDRSGNGPPLILVVGAFNDRSTGNALAAFLARRFTVFTYDRRGRGDSGDGAKYAPGRESEDLDAMVRVAGGAAAVFGFSSGARLALQAASDGVAITRLALFDLPPAQPAEHASQLEALVAAGRRGEAVEYFQRELVRIPPEVIAQLRRAPFRPALEALAHTLAYDATIMASPLDLGTIRQPTLLIAAGAAAPVMRKTAEETSRALPAARAVTIDGATHDLVPEVVGPVVERFLLEVEDRR